VEGDTELDIERTKYEVIRLSSGMSTVWSPEKKLTLCGCLLLLFSSVTPIVVLLPEQVRSVYLGDSPIFARLSVSFLGIFSVFVVTGGALGLFWVISKKNGTDEIDENLAWTLVSIEDISSGFALITGLIGCVACITSVSSGFRGLEFVDSLAESGVHPYDAGSFFSIPTVYLSALALVAGILVTGLAVYASYYQE